MASRNWNENELIAALSLYCQLPFGKLHRHNPAIQKLAKSLNRSPSAVALKLSNFASLDPTLKKRGISGMSNVSKADTEVWNRYFGKWDELVQRGFILPTPPDLSAATDTSIVDENKPQRKGEDKPTVATLRVGQSFFRNSVLAAYGGRCCITGIAEPALLRASHIVPWSVDTEHRLDPRNGLCLNALHDAAFDRGFITVNKDLTLRVASSLRTKMPTEVFRESFARFDGQPILSPEKFGPDQTYLAYHREKVYCG